MDYILVIIILYIAIILYFHCTYPEIYWDWKKISFNSIKFPLSFIWGAATAAHQVEGNCINNWSEFEKLKNERGIPNIKGAQTSGLACDHWNLYPNDIKLIKKLGVSHYRFSIEWSKIQPEQDIYNQDVVDHYSNMIDALIENNISPVVTLYHFTHPIWFEKLGAFEKIENINIFVKYCQYIFNEYSD